MLSKDKSWVDYLFLLVLLIGSLWQVAFLQATMKWDIMDITLPWNYYITECIAKGELPLWNPFINAGFAQMGVNDTWNPITWIIGLVFGYDPITIQWQYLGHLFFAGIGFYELGKFLGWSRTTCLTTASAYMLSGFMIGNAQHLGWTIGASWLPWVFLNFKKWEATPTFYRALILAILCALMFLGSYPGVFFGLVYILTFLFIIRFYRICQKKGFPFLKKMIQSSFIVGVNFLILTFVALVSMFRLSPYINRGEGLPIESALSGSLPWEAITAFLFPFASVSDKVMWGTDWTLVNVYIGLIPFIFLVFSFFKKSILEKTLPYLFGALFFFALAMGNDLPLRRLLHSVIPLLEVFRLPTYFRIFGIFFLLIVSGISLNSFFNHEKNDNAKILLWKYILGITLIILAISLWAKFKVYTDVEANIYNNISFQGLTHVILLTSILLGFYFFKKENLKKGLLLGVVIIDLFFSVQLNISSTVIHDINAKEVNTAFYRYSPKEYPLPNIKEPFQNLHRVANFDFVHLHVNLNHFHKIPTPDGASPLYFEWVGNAMEKGIYQKTIQNPLVFGVEKFSNDGQIIEETIDTLSFEKIKVINFSPNQIEFETSFDKNVFLVYLQNYHPDWKVFVDDTEKQLTLCNDVFLSVQLDPGYRKVKFVFDPTIERLSFYGTLLSWVGILFILFHWKRRKGE